MNTVQWQVGFVPGCDCCCGPYYIISPDAPFKIGVIDVPFELVDRGEMVFDVQEFGLTSQNWRTRLTELMTEAAKCTT